MIPLFDYESKSRIGHDLTLKEAFSDEFVFSLLKMNFPKSQGFKRLRTGDETIFQAYDNENEEWQIIAYFLIPEQRAMVYRVQNLNGVGPYEGQAGHYLLSINPRDRGPGPEAESFPPEALYVLDRKIGRCGFSSIEQLNQWFDKRDLLVLKDLGFEIIKIDAKRVWPGQKQVIFEP